MSFRIFATFALLALQVLGALSNPVDTNHAEEMVVTPGGLVPKSRVHPVPEGARVHHTATEVHLIASDGTILHSAPVSKKVTTQSKITGTGGTPTTLAPRAISSGYVAYSYWKNNGTSNIASLSTTWTVPSTPTKKDGQLLYIFNALIPNSFDGIFQPVLQFGSSPAGGGNYWAVASWYLIGSNTYYTVPAQVKAAQNLTGVMALKGTTVSGNTTTYNWNSVFSGVPSTSLSVSTTEVFNYAYEALEIYSVSSDSDLPTGKTTMGNINITTQDGLHPALNWTAISDTTDGFKMSLVSASSTNGSMQITYP